MDLARDRKLLNTLVDWDPAWYCARYPDVAASGLDPAVHYLRYGAVMGRNPGKRFNTRFYLAAHPEAAASGLNPLVHYALHGKAAGHATRAQRDDPRKQINVIRTKLLGLGFTERPLAELAATADGADAPPAARALAARELALWHMRGRTEAGYRTALAWIARARADAPDLDFRAKLSTVELLCHYHLGDRAAGLAAYDRAALAGEATPDLMLARVNFEGTAEARVLWINQVLARHGIEPVTLLPENGRPAYDRLTGATDLPKIADGPKVSVLVAAYDAADMLPTALQSLQDQTWQNLEIIVLDDASPTMDTMRVAEAFAARDPRIRAVRMAQNGGAYVARNHGLDLATGDFVTLHDADDWSHPKKIETQVRFLTENPEVMGCTSEQARMHDDLSLPACVRDGILTHVNTSSLMFHRAPAAARLGYWDRVRFSADNEFLRRMRHAFGGAAVRQLAGSVHSFQRTGSQSVMADPLRGMSDFLYGARREYLDAQYHVRSRAGNRGGEGNSGLRYGNTADERPFPVPALMLAPPGEEAGTGVRFDRILATDFRYASEQLTVALDDLRRWRAQGLSCAVFELNDHDAREADGGFRAHMLPEARQAIWDSGTRIVTYGECVACVRLVIHGARCLLERQRYIPAVTAQAIEVLAGALSEPSQALTESDRARCMANLKAYFGTSAMLEIAD